MVRFEENLLSKGDQHCLASMRGIKLRMTFVGKHPPNKNVRRNKKKQREQGIAAVKKQHKEELLFADDHFSYKVTILGTLRIFGLLLHVKTGQSNLIDITGKVSTNS